MTPQYVISQLLESDTKYPQNLNLLKKIILATYLGRLRINGLPPDNKVNLASYLFDNERLMFDYTRMSDEGRKEFEEWLLHPHQDDKEEIGFSSVSVNEYRGFTAESLLSWWGRLKLWLQGKVTEHWKINDLELSLNYQLTGIEISHGQNGSLIGFNQYLVPPTGTKYKDPEDLQNEPLGNTKRVFLTDKLVKQLKEINLNQFNFRHACKTFHPSSVEVPNQQSRFKEMNDYRKMQKYLALKPWYLKIFYWLKSFFLDSYPEDVPELVDNSLESIFKTDKVHIFQRRHSKEIFVREKKPDIENIVFCGGGAKIFAHVGVWKALCEAKIKPIKFAGSSSGAIMALLCYLGYSADEIAELFTQFKKEHLVLFDINRNGLSDPRSLKMALDFVILKKVKQIVEKYQIPFPTGLITFKTLDNLRKRFPDCGIGEKLVVTVTNKPLRLTVYYSVDDKPNFEVSEAVKISASLPVLFRPTSIDGEEHNDGGVLSNFPTEAFSDDFSTLLESDYGNSWKTLAVQFDNGTERNTIDRVMDKVYRENIFLNWLYRLITGVKDPASGWEQDRLKLRKYAAQSVIVNVGDVSSAGFSVGDEPRKMMIDNGYNSTLEYLDIRYSKCDQDQYQNKELMYSTFTSLGDLLAYSCYRGEKYWFEIANDLIAKSELPNRAALMKQSLVLRELYFKDKNPSHSNNEAQDPNTFFGNRAKECYLEELGSQNHKHVLALYPILLKLGAVLVKEKADIEIFDRARHSITLNDPFEPLNHFAKIKGETHFILNIFVTLMTDLKNNGDEGSYARLVQLQHTFNIIIDNKNLNLYGKWNLSVAQSMRILKSYGEGKTDAVIELLHCLRENSEPMQIIENGAFKETTGEEQEEQIPAYI